MKAQVLSWYIAVVVLVFVAVGAFGMIGPWMISQPDSLLVVVGFAVYIIGLPVFGFGAWKLVESIIDYHKSATGEVK